MTTLQLNIPDDLEALLRDVEGGAEEFILQTVRRQLLEKQERQAFEARLEEEYRVSAEEDAELLEDFKHVDREGWEDDH